MYCLGEKHTGEDDMLEQVQVIKENDQAKFAVIPYEEYLYVKSLLNDEAKLADYLDYLHMQNVKRQSAERLSWEEVQQELMLE